MNKNLHKHTNNKNKGFSIVEVIIYFSMLAIMSTLVITSIINLFKNYNVIKANQYIEYNAISIIDKLTRDTRDAQSIDIVDSSFSVAQGSVSLNIASSTNEAVTNSVKFYLENNKIKYMKDGVYFGNLSTNNVAVSNFKIYYINASSTEAIKVELNLEIIPHLNTLPISKNFYTTIQLRE